MALDSVDNPASGEACTLQAVLLHSVLLSRLGVPHAFTTRLGGVSGGMFSSLNFGNPGDLPAERRDSPSNIAANWRILKLGIGKAMGGAPDRLFEREIVEVHQVHGKDVWTASASEPSPRTLGRPDVKADAIVTDDSNRLAAIRVADCTPILLSSSDGAVVAAIHAGWRGVIDGVVPAALLTMADLGVASKSAVAAIGPCIGPDAFEVGPEVAAEFRRVFGEDTTHIRPGMGDRLLVDLKGAIREQLIAAGLAAGNIDVLPHCTVRDADQFFSHRRSGGLTGRMVGIIGPRAG